MGSEPNNRSVETSVILATSFEFWYLSLWNFLQFSWSTMASWMDQGITGTTQVATLKATLKGARQRNTMSLNDLTRKLGIFKEFVSGLDEEDKGSSFVNDELKAVLEAKTTVESTFGIVTKNVADLTALMSEMQLSDSKLTEAHVDQLGKEVTAEEKKYAERCDKVEEKIREANKLLVQWNYKPPEHSPFPPPPTFFPPTQKRRFQAVDSFKPKLLSLEATYEDFLDFRKRFLVFTKACYETVPLVDGFPDITYEEGSTLLLTCIEPGWSKKIIFEDYKNVDALLNKFDEEIQLTQPLHLRRISLIKIASNRGEKASALMRKLMEASKVADLHNLSPEALVLHLFLDKCIECEDNKEIKNKAIEILRNKSQRGMKVEQKDLELFLTFTKEIESNLLSRTGKTSKILKTDQTVRPCPICKKTDHPRYRCTLKCVHCGGTNHPKEKCWQLPENSHKRPAPSKQPDSTPNKPTGAKNTSHTDP